MKLRKTLTPWFVTLAVLSAPGAAGLNMYLLDNRPVVPGTENAADQPNLLCGRVTGPVHCVRISDRDFYINTLLDGTALFTVIPCMLFLAAARRANSRLGLDD
jgi:hypothetical protein